MRQPKYEQHVIKMFINKTSGFSLYTLYLDVINFLLGMWIQHTDGIFKMGSH